MKKSKYLNFHPYSSSPGIPKTSRNHLAFQQGTFVGYLVSHLLVREGEIQFLPLMEQLLQDWSEHLPAHKFQKLSNLHLKKSSKNC